MNTRKGNKLYVGTTIVALAIGVTYACKAFLNTEPQRVLGESALLTKSGVEGLLPGAYRSLDCSSSSAGSWGCAASNWVWGSVTSGDAHKGSNLGDQAPVFEIETYLWSAGDVQDYLNQKWSQVYEGISRANTTLRFLAKVRTEKPTEINDAEAKGIRGEAIFLRAHYHFEAYRMWAHIPYYFETDTTPVAQGGFRKPNNLPLDSVVKLIIADLDTAIALLDSTPRNDEVGRASAWTAKAYKGRVQAYAAAIAPAFWDSALVTLRDVQANGPYSLETSFDHVWTAFTQFQNGPETILAFQASVRDGEPSGWNSNWGERLNFPHSGSHFGCCGFHQPSQNLVNFYQVDANGMPLAVTNANWNTTAALGDTNFAGGNITPVDPRLDWTVGRDNVPYKDWGLHNRSWIRDASYSGPFSPKKNVQENAANGENNVGWQATQTNDVNIHIFRYADLLLLLAEAEVERGTLANALTIVNQIRARAGRVAQGCGKGFDAKSDSILKATYPACVGDSRMVDTLIQTATIDSLRTPWALYRIGLYPSFPSQAYARTAIQYERRLELAMEGQRFFDLRRWGGADTVIANYVLKEKSRIPYLGTAAIFSLPKYALYPIPTVQIEVSRSGAQDNLVQNPGW